MSASMSLLCTLYQSTSQPSPPVVDLEQDPGGTNQRQPALQETECLNVHTI